MAKNPFDGWKYHHPTPGCTHWSITDATGQEIGCPHLGLPTQLIDFLNQEQESITPEVTPAAEKPQKSPAPITPGTISTRPPELSITSRPDYLKYAPSILEAEGYSITSQAAQYAQYNGIPYTQVLETIQFPSDNFPSRENYVYRSEYADVIVGGQDKKLIINVAPPNRFNRHSYGKAKPSATHSRRTFQKSSEVFKALTDHGYQVTLQSGGHYQITDPTRPGLSCHTSATPSDGRAIENLLTQIRAEFGLDLRTR